MRRKRLLSFAIVVPGLVLAICTNVRSQSEITLLAPRPMQPTIDKIVAQFQSKTSQSVRVTYQTAKLIRQSVAKGQPLDVSLIAAPFPGAIASGTISLGSATPVAGFLTGVAVPKGAPKPDISTPAAVKKALLAAKSIGYEDPEFAIDGEVPSEVINKLGIADQVAAKIKVCAGAAAPYSSDSVCFDPSGSPGPRRSTLTQNCAPNSNCFTPPLPGSGGSVFSIQKQLSRGEVAFAMLFLSDMIPNDDKFDIVGVLPRKLCAPISVVGFIATHASNPEGAKRLLQYLASPEVQANFKTDGYEPHS